MLGNRLVTKPVFPEAMEFLKSRVAVDANSEDRVLSRTELITRLQGKKAAMKPNCVVVNTSRGPVIDEAALARALQSGKLAAAGLGVFEREPLIDPSLVGLHNVVLAPHIASASRETRLRMCMMAAENLVAGLKGERPANLVNPDVLHQRRH